MPPKRKGKAAKNKNEAPPARTTRGKKKIESDKKTPVTPPDPSSDDSSDEELFYGDYSRYLASGKIARDADYEFTPEDDAMFAKFNNPYSKEAQEEIMHWYRIHRDADGNLLEYPSENPYDFSILETKMEESLKNQRSWFLKQNEELLKLLDRLHQQEYNEVGHQEEEILDRISDFTLVLFEYVKTLKKRKGRGAVCV